MKAVLTVIGKDKPGIIAKVSTLLADNAVNIEDISQTIMSGNFTMLMYTDISACKIPLAELADVLKALGDEIGVSIHIQHEGIFDAMHKI